MKRKLFLVIIISFEVLFLLAGCDTINHLANSIKKKRNEKTSYDKLYEYFLYAPFFINPEIIVYPYDGDSNVSSDTDISLYFSEPVNKSGNWKVTVDSITYNNSSPEVSWDSIHTGDYNYPELIIHPRKPLMRGKTISLVADGFSPENAIGSFAKVNTSFSISWSNLSVSVIPSNNAMQIAVDSDIVLTFSESADPSINWKVTIDGVAYNNSSTEILWNEQHTVLTIKPVNYFKRSKIIILSESGFAASYDECPFPTLTSKFAVLDSPGAMVSPSGVAVHPDTNIVITFSEPMVPDDGWSVTAAGITYTKDSPGICWNDTKTLTINKTQDFAPLTKITANIQGFHAAIDNYPFFSTLTISFTTGLRIESIPVNNAIGSGTMFSSVVDSNNGLYVSYFDMNKDYPVYMTNISGSWQSYPIDTQTFLGDYIALGIDLTNSLLAVYTDYWYGNAIFAKNVNGTWNKEKFDPSNNKGRGAAIATDSSNAAHISYWNTYPTTDLLYATNQGGSWTLQTIDSKLSSGGFNSSIAVDSKNNIHISYYGGDNLRYATNSDGSWKTYIIDSNRFAGYSSVIAVDSNDAVYIAYYDNSDSFNSYMRYATNKSGSWQRYKIDTVENTNNDISICVDSQNVIYICYIDYIQSEYKCYLKLASTISGICSIYYADSDEWLGDNASMTMDSNNAIHIFYDYGFSNVILRHATNAP